MAGQQFTGARILTVQHKKLKRISKDSGKSLDRLLEEAIDLYVARWKREEQVRQYAASLDVHAEQERLLREFIARLDQPKED
jgi:hypothetical protein